ncbi:MAG: SPASM domain-containing protein [Thermodesulfobacteriota bacterium]|nr:SPASM domain-containing protein [Thermodesulfobacteriota bacterium]
MMNPIYKFKIAEKMFALDVEGCFVFEIDGIAWEVLEYFGKMNRKDILSKLGHKFAPQEVETVIDELDTLRNQGYILKERTGGESTQEEDYMESISLYSMEFTQGDFLMDRTTAENCINFLIMKSAALKELKIEFVVKPSLLNPDMIEHAYNYAQTQGNIFKKEFQFCLTIIGIPLDDCRDSGEANITFNFRDIKDIKGLLKYLTSAKREQKGQLLKIERFASALKKNSSMPRINLIPTNSNFPRSISIIFDLGFSSISLGCDHSLSSLYLSLREERYPLKERYEIIASDYLKRLEQESSLSLHPFKSVFKQVYKGKRCTRRCQAGKRLVTVSADGDIYPCPQFLKIKECRIGNINNLDYDLTMEARFRALSVNEKEDCFNCWARYFCGGGCSALAYLFNEKIASPYQKECNFIKDIIRLGVMTYSRLEEKTQMISRIKSEGRDTHLGFSLNGGQIKARFIEKNDSAVSSKWREGFSQSYFLTEGVEMGLQQGKCKKLSHRQNNVELILEDKEKMPLGLFRGRIFLPFNQGEISIFTPNEENLKEEEFCQIGLSFLYEIFHKWNLPRIFAALLETERGYLEYLKQFGFKVEGLLREQIFHHGKYHNLIALGLLKGELKKK